VICDFTSPTASSDTQVYSREWFQQVKRVLLPKGVVSTNGVSPEHTTLAFWCLYQTLLAAGLATKPMQIQIPSFHHHEYGDWGFFLSADGTIDRTELETIELPAEFQLQSDWLKAFQIKSELADRRHTVTLHSLESPQLYYYLLNPDALPKTSKPEDVSEPEEIIDFLDLQEEGTGLVGTQNLLELDAIVQLWLEQLRESHQDDRAVDLASLLPVQHRYHTPRMTQEWLGYGKSLLGELMALVCFLPYLNGRENCRRK
jgi:spermidine synthase